jgi:hypothetical protein
MRRGEVAPLRTFIGGAGMVLCRRDRARRDMNPAGCTASSIRGGPLRYVAVEESDPSVATRAGVLHRQGLCVPPYHLEPFSSLHFSLGISRSAKIALAFSLI